MIFFWAVVVGAFAITMAIGLSRPAPSQPDSQATPKTSESTPQITLQPAQPAAQPFKLVALQAEDGTSKIVQLDQDAGNPKTLYNDKNDQEKLKAVAGLKNDGSVLYLVVARPQEEFKGKLVEISTDGKANTKTLREEITFLTPPVVSPVGDKLALTSFNNEEKDFGFSVSLENLDGSDKKTVYKSAETISIVDFSSDGAKLALVKSSPSGGSQLVVVDLAAGTNHGVYSTPNTIMSADYETSQIVLSQAPTGKNKANEAELYRTDPDGKNVTKLTGNTAAESQLVLTPDGKAAAYLQVSYADGLATPGVTGNLVVFDLDKKTELLIGKGTGVVGWLR